MICSMFVLIKGPDMLSIEPPNDKILEYIVRSSGWSSRYEIDRHLLSKGFTPLQIEGAWQTFRHPTDEQPAKHSALYWLFFVVVSLTLFAIISDFLSLTSEFPDVPNPLISWSGYIISAGLAIFLTRLILSSTNLKTEAKQRKYVLSWLLFIGLAVGTTFLAQEVGKVINHVAPFPVYPGGTSLNVEPNIGQSLMACGYNMFPDIYPNFTTSASEEQILAYYCQIVASISYQKLEERAGSIHIYENQPKDRAGSAPVEDTSISGTCFFLSMGRSTRANVVVVLNPAVPEEARVIKRFFSQAPSDRNVVILSKGFFFME